MEIISTIFCDFVCIGPLKAKTAYLMIKGAVSVHLFRYIFQTRVQPDTETFDQLVTELSLLFQDCNYDRSDEMVHD